MEIEGNLIPGRFLARDNRFRVTVDVGGQPVAAHLPNSGRLGELLLPDRPVLLIERLAVWRKTRYDLALVELDGQWVSVDSRLPNDLVEEALHAGRLSALAGHATVRREVTFGRSRFDLLLEAPGTPPFLVEVKSVTLVIGGLACFPDAVTLRGRRHVEELAAAVEVGYRAAVVFVVQRNDVVGFRPHDESDPGFARALRQAAESGVEVYAYACRVQPARIEIDRPLTVHLGGPGPIGA
jgi:sugar fermentation stimulation protein A